jgi:hypothetical protein
MWLNNRTVDSGYSALYCGNELDRIPHLIFNIENRESPFSWESFDWNDPSSLFYILETHLLFFGSSAISCGLQSVSTHNTAMRSDRSGRIPLLYRPVLFIHLISPNPTTNVYINKKEMNNFHPKLWKMKFAQTADQTDEKIKRSKKKKWNRQGSKLFKYYKIKSIYRACMKWNSLSPSIRSEIQCTWQMHGLPQWKAKLNQFFFFFFFLTALMRSSTDSVSVYCALYETHLANNKMKEFIHIYVCYVAYGKRLWNTIRRLMKNISPIF